MYLHRAHAFASFIIALAVLHSSAALSNTLPEARKEGSLVFYSAIVE